MTEMTEVREQLGAQGGQVGRAGFWLAPSELGRKNVIDYGAFSEQNVVVPG